MNSEDRQIRDLLLKVDTMSTKHEDRLQSRIMRQLPSRSLRRIYLIVFLVLLWGGGIGLLIRYWHEIAHVMLAMFGTLLDFQLPTVETFVTFVLGVGTIVLIIWQSYDVLDEYYEQEIRWLLKNN